MEFNPQYLISLKKFFGVLFGSGLEREFAKIEWLKSNFKYKRFAVPPSLWEWIPQHENIQHTSLYFENVDIILESLMDSDGLEFSVVETIALASALLTPISVLSEEAFDKMKPAAQILFRGEKPKNEKQIISLIFDCYNMTLQSYENVISIANEYFDGIKTLKDTIISRRNYALNNTRNKLWKFGDGTRGDIIFAYLDLIPFIANADGEQNKWNKFPFWNLVPVCII